MEARIKDSWFKIFLPVVLVVLSLILISLKVNRLPSSSFENIVIAHTGSLKEAIAEARGNGLPPFVSVITTLFKSGLPDNLYFLKLPEILAGLASVLLFYALLRQLKFPRPFLLALLPATSFVFVYFSQAIEPAIWLAGGVLALAYFSYRVFLAEEAGFWPVVVLAATFLVLSMFHFIALWVIAALDITLIVFLIGLKRFSYLPRLLFFNLFAIIHFIPWGDVVGKFFVKSFGLPGVDFSLSHGKEAALTKFNFTGWQSVFYKFLGGNDLSGKFLLVVTIVLFIFLIWRVSKKALDKKLVPAEKLTAFMLIFSVVFITIILLLPPLWPAFLENYSILLWPFWFVLAAALAPLFELKRPISRLALYLLLVLFVLHNLISNI